MIKTESKDFPALKIFLQDGLLINFDIEKIMKEFEETEETFHQYNQVKVSKNAVYDEIVSAIIHSKYDADAETALINNHLIENGDETEFDEYQELRTKAKLIAHCVIGDINIESKTVTELNELSEILSLDISGLRKAKKINKIQDYIH